MSIDDASEGSQSSDDFLPLVVALRELRKRAWGCVVALALYALSSLFSVQKQIGESDLGLGGRVGLLGFLILLTAFMVGIPAACATLAGWNAGKAANTRDIRAAAETLIWSRRFIAAIAVWVVGQTLLVTIAFRFF